MFFDDKVTGAEVAYAPTENWTVKATAGKIDAKGDAFTNDAGNTSGNYGALEANYKNGKLEAGIGYHVAGGNQTMIEDNGDYKVWDAGVGYAFSDTVKATVDYAQGNSWKNDEFSKSAYSIQLNYKGANAAQKGSWGAYVAYRQLSPIAAFQTTYDLKKGVDGWNSLKGWELGADYAWAKNIVSTLKFFTGKDTDSAQSGKDKVTGVWSRVDFMF